MERVYREGDEIVVMNKKHGGRRFDRTDDILVNRPEPKIGAYQPSHEGFDPSGIAVKPEEIKKGVRVRHLYDSDNCIGTVVCMMPDGYVKIKWDSDTPEGMPEELQPWALELESANQMRMFGSRSQ